MNHFQHETACVDPGAQIGQGTKIWHWTHVCAHAVVGDHCILGQSVFIADRVILGHGVKVQNHVSIYEGVIIEDGVFCGPHMVFTNVINPRAFIERKQEYKTTRIKKGASIGANATIVCGHTLGAYCLIGAGCVIRCDVPDFALMVGVPGRQIGWVSRAGMRLDLPIFGEGEATCPLSGERYRLSNHTLTIQEVSHLLQTTHNLEHPIDR